MNKAPGRRKRTLRVQAAMVARNLSAVPCTQRPKLLTLSNLAPAVGTVVAVEIADGRIASIIPEDALALPHCRADETVAFRPRAHEEMNCGRAALNAASTKALDCKLPGMDASPARIGMKSDYFHPPACHTPESAYGSTLPRPAWAITPAVSPLLVGSLLMGVTMPLPPFAPGSILIVCNNPERAFRMQPGATNQFFHIGALYATHRDRSRKARET